MGFLGRVKKEDAHLEIKVKNEKPCGALAKRRAGACGDLAEGTSRFLRDRFDGAGGDVAFDLVFPKPRAQRGSPVRNRSRGRPGARV